MIVPLNKPFDWEADKHLVPNFSKHEFDCKGTGHNVMVHGFMVSLQRLRNAYKKPIIITSGYRAPEYNVQVSTTGPNGPHTTGKAADIAIDRKDAHRLSHLAFACGFSGIGWQQKGNGRFIHLDMLTEDEGHFPRPTIWTY